MRLFQRERDPALNPGSGDGSVSDVLGVASERIREIVEAAERAATDIDAKVRSSPGMKGDETSKISRERLVAELAESLIARADELSRDAANLADVLERASTRLDAMAPPPTREVGPSQGTGKSDAVKAGVGSATGMSKPISPLPAATTPPPAPPVAPKSGNLSKSGALSAKVTERFKDQSPETGIPSRFKRRASSTKTARPAERSTEGLRLLATQMAVAGSTHEEIAARLRDEFGVKDATELLGEAPNGTIKASERDG